MMRCSLRWRESVAVALLLVAAACVRTPARTERAAAPADADSDVRVAISAGARQALISSTGAFTIVDATTGRILATGGARDQWTLTPAANGLALSGPSSARSLAPGGAVFVHASGTASLITHDGRRYRGTLHINRADSTLTVVNSLPVESYLRGVLPIEIGNRTAAEAGAVAAQAVAARSFTYVRLQERRRDARRSFDLLATTSDQVYGGVDVERPLHDEQIARTRGLVLTYGGRTVNAVYSSTCGGTTAEAPEVWRSSGEPYLRRISDRIPGTGRAYCDIAPRFAWTRSLDSQQLLSGINAYLGSYSAMNGLAGVVKSVHVNSTTPSGRVGTVAIDTDAGLHELRGNDIRYVLRAAGSEILNSTMFTIASVQNGATGIALIEFVGNGYGHGIGMCQWGAIGRARAGQDYRSILQTYFPGTSIERFRWQGQ